MRNNTEILVSVDLESQNWNSNRISLSLVHSHGLRESGGNETKFTDELKLKVQIEDGFIIYIMK